MSKHTLIAGVEFIENLRLLGQILNYHVKLELSIDSGEKKTKAVDVAWFKEPKQKFPLFIFEIESNVTNAATYNPLKVFAEKNESFEKPLFFFQIFLKRGQESSKIKDLRNQFGSFNYRAYLMSTNNKHAFIFDVLSQHRRISSELAISKLFDFFIKTKWLGMDLQSLADHIEVLHFETTSGMLLSSYIYLSSIYSEMIPIADNYLKKIHQDYYSNDYPINYGTYIGDTWHYPIHLGIIFSVNNDLYTKNKMFQQLKEWQENKPYISMIGPHFGLSSDYDDFIIWGAGGLFALLSALFKDYEKITLYFIDELKKIIDNTNQKYRIPNLLWLLHILPRSAAGNEIWENYVVPAFKELNSFSMKHLISPPFLDTNASFIETFLSGNDNLPTLRELDELIEKKRKPLSAVQIACSCLTTANEIGLNIQILKAIY